MKRKKSFTQTEVDAIIFKRDLETKDKILGLQEKIENLKRDNEKLREELYFEKQKNSSILKSLEKSSELLNKMEEQTALNLENEINDLKKFRALWSSYYVKIVNNYPITTELKKFIFVEKKINEILSSTFSLKEKKEEIERAIDFNPSNLIERYFKSQEQKSEIETDLFSLCEKLGIN